MTFTQGDAAHGVYKVNSLVLNADADPLEGDVRWDPARSLWNAGMLAASLLLAPLFFTWSGLAICIVLLLVTMCTGQLDLGYDFVRLLERLGLAWDVQTPDTLPPRLGITQLPVAAE